MLGELHFGILNSGKVEKNLAKLTDLINGCHVLVVDTKTAQIYAQTRLALKQAGKPIPENDLWIAALCLEHQLALATSDAHFQFVSGLVVSSLA